MNEEKDGIIQKIFEWIKENYLKVLVVFLVISSLFIASLLRSNYKEQKSLEASIIYEQFHSYINDYEDDLSQAIELKKDFERNFSNQIYLDLMNMSLAKKYISMGNTNEAINSLTEANYSLESKDSDVYFIRDLSRIRLSMLLISQNKFQDAREILNKDFMFYKPLKYEFLGDLEKELLNVTLAKEHFKKALSLTQSKTHKGILNIKISSIIE
ncbi:tetratricopeptide repeat protein [SAR86 cluster bacterium]|nr:tetratricopeptide repeat protein [SAR86 cluster bacterium]